MSDVGKKFLIRADDDWYTMKCTKQTVDTRTFEEVNGAGFVVLDWMEFIDQKSLGRIQELDDG